MIRSNNYRSFFSGFTCGIIILTLGLVFVLSSPTQAQVKKVTAGEVVDRESLKDFVTWATSEFISVSTMNEGLELVSLFREEGGDYNVGNMYLILLNTDGFVFLHGEDPTIDGKSVLSVVDDDGTKIFDEVLTADDREGKFVEYCWDDPTDTTDVRCKDSFALRYYSQVSEIDLIVLGGYYQDLSSAGDELPNIPLPDISASEVVDRLTLKQFVLGTGEWMAELLAQVGPTAVSQWKGVLREEGGHFKSGATYLYIINPDGYVILHAADPWREGRTVIDNTDFRGTLFIRDLIKTAQSGGGFIQYYWDDPSVEGDEEFGTQKVAYAKAYENKNAPSFGKELILAAGFYRNFPTSGQAQVQLIHNLPIEIPVNLYLDDIQIMEGFQFRNATAYDNLPAGVRMLSILPDGAPVEQALMDTLTLMHNQSYAIAVHGSIEAPAVKVIETETKSAVENMIDVNLVHGSSDLGHVDVRTIDPIDNMTPIKLIANNFSFNEVSSYITVEPGLYNLQITTSNNSEELAVFGIPISHKYRNETLVLNLSGSKDAPKDAFNALKLYGVDIRGDEVSIDVITDVETEISELPTEFMLYGNYPNPFNPSTRIQFDLPESAQVSVQVMDMLGREVMILPAKEFEAGSNRVIELNALNLASGTYLYRMIANGAERRFVKTGRMTLMK